MKKIFYWRWLLVWLGLVSLFSLLVFRLFDLTILGGSKYRQIVDQNRLQTQPTIAGRGLILDRYGDALAWNMPVYLVASASAEGKITKTYLDPAQAFKLLTSSESAQIQQVSERHYKSKLALSTAMGYVGEASSDDLAANANLEVGQWVGKTGLEKSLNSQLVGHNGQITWEVDVGQNIITKLKEEAAQAGQDITTSLDPYLSEIAYRSMGDWQGAVVIADGQTGQILSLISKPSYPAEVFAKLSGSPDERKQRRTQVSSLLVSPDRPLYNRAVLGSYPPGSIFKPIVAMAGLESGQIDANFQVLDEGVLKVGDYQYGSWMFKQFGHGEGLLNLTRAIARSNDIYFYKVAEATGPDRIAQMANLFGLGKPVGLELTQESGGLVPTPEWKQATLGERWYLGNTYHYGIGQGDLLVTPVQMAQATQVLANGGQKCQLTLLTHQPECEDLGFQKNNLNIVLQGMIEACSTGGTAASLFSWNTDIGEKTGDSLAQITQGKLACKTGTAEFGAADEKGRRKTHGWMIATVHIDPKFDSNPVQLADFNQFTPIDSSVPSSTLRTIWGQKIAQGNWPKSLVIAVLTESDAATPFKEGSREAGGVIREIINWIKG